VVNKALKNVMEICVAAKKKMYSPGEIKNYFYRDQILPKKNFVGTGRGIERFVEFVVELKIGWEDFKVSNCMALNFMRREGLAIFQVNRLYFSKV
jgi:hypothetical protein